MKKFFLLALAVTMFIACQNKPQRYFDASPEIETLKAGIKAYEAQDWDAWKSNFADSAKIFHNTNKAAAPEQMVVGMKNMLSNFSSYGFAKEGGIYEMVIDKEGKTWVNFWGNWGGKANVTEKQLVIPVHLTVEFVNGKITQEYAYYDTAGINKTLKANAEAKAAQEAETSKE
ncbi:nuclear transport factor 2 family protein [uncultured Algibacter sp.]|uniref:nuclear transport factor 2 family protein n=1 Tax=uncultured Algibacter sp. TaxID=298659 RepID=UPI00263691FD|nr:nuclear transport factor 2 family protein [uncultured Algibacter sp.]